MSPAAFALRDDPGRATWYPVLVATHAALPLFSDEDEPKVPCCIGRDGAVSWRVRPEECTLREVMETIASGLLQARTDCIGYMLGGGRGNGYTPELMHLWQTFLPWVHDLTSATLGVLLAEFAAVLSRHWRQWRARRARPEDLIDLLLAKRWEVEELAERLNISTTEALELLRAISEPAEPGTAHERVRESRGEFTAILLAHRHIEWYAPFGHDEALRIIESNPGLHLENDRYYIAPDEGPNAR